MLKKVKASTSNLAKELLHGELKIISIDETPRKINEVFSAANDNEKYIIIATNKYGDSATQFYMYKTTDPYLFSNPLHSQMFAPAIPNNYKINIHDSDEDVALLKKFKETYVTRLNKALYYTGQIGSDPEIFVESKKGLMPAFEFLPHKNKAIVTEGTFKTSVYWDGFQAEMSTQPNITCLAHHVDELQAGLKILLATAKTKDKTAKLSNKTTMTIDPDLLSNGKDEHVDFGCAPSFNAYGLSGIKLPGREVMFRPVGGHIHFGLKGLTEENALRAVKALDAILGVACVAMFKGYDDPRRRAMYGLPGEYRLPAHGLEYRVLSNAWLIHPLIAHMVFDLARKVVAFGLAGWMDQWEHEEEETIRIITSCNVSGAKKSLIRNKELFLNILDSKYIHREHSVIVYNSFLHGIDSFISKPDDLVANWDLDKTWNTQCASPNKRFSNAIPSLVKGLKVV